MPDGQVAEVVAAKSEPALAPRIVPQTDLVNMQNEGEASAVRARPISTAAGSWSVLAAIPLAVSLEAPALPARQSAPPAPANRPNALPMMTGHVASPLLTPADRPHRRLSMSGWLLLRRDAAASLAPAGALGGSQAGARFLYQLNDDARRPLALSGRLYAPLRRTAGSEAAVGLDWQPSAGIPIHILAERRQRLGREGRSAFSVTIYGGGSATLGRGWRLDGYGQAGIVGTRSRDAFIDGSVRLSRAFGPVEVGGALWGAAQPGASRLDAGPHVTLPIRAAGASLRLSADYRFRIAGDARPASGPALSLGVDF